MQNILNKVNDIRNYLLANVKEREDQIEGLLTALVARLHVLLIGLPGTAKSKVTTELTSLIDGTDYFQWLMTKFTTPEELFGPYDLSKLKTGVYERITQGKLPTAHIGYLDEIWKANSAILNSLLTLINERSFYNGTKIEQSPLMTMVGTSNEYPQEEELQAAFDRFMLRFETSYIKEDAHFADMLLGNNVPKPAPLTLAELEQLQQATKLVTIDQSVVDAIISLRVDLQNQGIILSDRRWFQCVRQLLPARAVLAGRTHIVIEEDAEILQHALWDDPSQKSTVATIVRKRLDPLAGKLAELIEDAQDIANSALKAPDEQNIPIGTEAIKKLKNIRKEIEAFQQAGGSPAKLEKVKQADTKLEELLKGVTKKCLGI